MGRAHQHGKLQIIVEQMAKQGISIVGMAEMLWKGDTSFQMRAEQMKKDKQL